MQMIKRVPKFARLYDPVSLQFSHSISDKNETLNPLKETWTIVKDKILWKYCDHVNLVHPDKVWNSIIDRS